MRKRPQFFDLNGNGHGFVLRGTTYTVVDVSGSTNTRLQGVNDLGQIAVTADAAPGCGFLYDVNRKTFDSLPCAGIGSNVYAVNNRGQFAGLNFDSVDPDNLWHGFIATPVRTTNELTETVAPLASKSAGRARAWGTW